MLGGVKGLPEGQLAARFLGGRPVKTGRSCPVLGLDLLRVAFNGSESAVLAFTFTISHGPRPLACGLNPLQGYDLLIFSRVAGSQINLDE